MEQPNSKPQSPAACMLTTTYTGHTFDLLNPKPSDIRTNDLAWGLAAIRPYGAVLQEPYSLGVRIALLAQHVMQEVPDPMAAAAAMLFKAHHAYVGLPLYPACTTPWAQSGDHAFHQLRAAIFRRYRVDWPSTALLNVLQQSWNRVIATELRDLKIMEPGPPAPPGVEPIGGLLRSMDGSKSPRPRFSEYGARDLYLRAAQQQFPDLADCVDERLLDGSWPT
jgi:hypothetical protein